MNIDKSGQWVHSAYVQFPGFGRGVKIPRTSRTAAMAGVAMLGGTRRAALIAQWSGFAFSKLVGPRWLPGSSRPLEAAVSSRLGVTRLSSLVDAVSEHTPTIDAIAFLERRQESRPGIALIAASADRAVAFVRAQPAQANQYRDEALVLAALCDERSPAASPESPIIVPRMLATGIVDDWEWIALEPLPLRIHRPDFDAPLDRITYAVQGVLEPVLASLGRTRTGADWQPMHGDFAPWNLRKIGSTRVLFDWERADYGPPHADAVYYAAAVAAVTLRPMRTLGVDPDALEPAVDYWAQVISSRSSEDGDQALAVGMLRALRGEHPRRERRS